MTAGNCEYVRQAYGVPACIGRRITFCGRPGFITKDMGAYIGVTFDDESVTNFWPLHPKEKGLEYGDMGKPRKLTRSQKRYQEFKDADWFDGTFAEWLGIKHSKTA